MFLASAYEHFIFWQNNFIISILSQNKKNGILKNYISQLEQEIDIQEAGLNEIINIDDNTYKTLNELIISFSMRNIFKENKINYQNYNNIIYNYDYIEKELAKIILPGLKKFKNDKIKFVTYLFEGFRGQNSCDLVDFNAKYEQKDLSDEEKNYLNEFIRKNNNSKFFKDIFNSLQILIKEIGKDNYEENYYIYDILKHLPKSIILNEELASFFKDKYELLFDLKTYTVNSLISIFEYFELLLWKEIKKLILLDYRIEISFEIKNYIINYFNNNKQNLINKKNFTSALRKFISRSLAGIREDFNYSPDSQLKFFISREDIWNKTIINDDEFELFINDILKDDIKVCHCFDLYNVLEGDNIMDH